jgi:density-regulated protein DRP1
VTIRVVDRTKRKRVTEISGLDSFQIDLKKASKLFSSKFACGSSITKLATGIEEIHIAGDFADDVKLLIQDVFELSPNDITIAEPKKK